MTTLAFIMFDGAGGAVGGWVAGRLYQVLPKHPLYSTPPGPRRVPHLQGVRGGQPWRCSHHPPGAALAGEEGGGKGGNVLTDP